MEDGTVSSPNIFAMTSRISSARTPKPASASTGLSVMLRLRSLASSALKPVSTRMSRPEMRISQTK
jgi:hypothetical protein